MKMTVHIKLLILTLALGLWACSGSDNGSGYKPDYVGVWTLETPVTSSIPMIVSVSNPDGSAQPQTMTTTGETTINLEILDDGSATEQLQFTMLDFPSCSPCTLNATMGYLYEHLGNRFTQEGLLASHVRFINQNADDTIEGYAYVSDGRLCFSNNLSFMLHSSSDGTSTPANSDPLALNFDNCFVQS
jgi:hypothetical protein